MTDVRLVPTELNAIFGVIATANIPSTNFEWKEFDGTEQVGHRQTTSYRGSELACRNSDFFYRSGIAIDRFSPGEKTRIGYSPVGQFGASKWQVRLTTVAEWAHRLKEELEAPDLWAEVMATRSLSIGTALTPTEERFTNREVLTIAESLKRIEAGVTAQHQLTTSQTQAMHEGFEEVKQNANRFGKKDWVNHSIGLLVNIMVGTGFSPTAARDLINMFSVAVTPMLDVAHRILQSGQFN